MNNGSSTSGIVIGVLVVAVIVIVGWIAYTQGFFQAKEQADNTSDLNVNIGGSYEK